MTLKASKETTDGAYSLIEQVAPTGFAPPRHVHHGEDEAFYILEGEVTYFAGDQTIQGSAGTYVYLPLDIPHSFRVEGATPARRRSPLNHGSVTLQRLSEKLNADVKDDVETKTNLIQL